MVQRIHRASVNCMSRSGSILLKTLSTTSPMSCTFTSSSTTTMHLVNMAWPSAQIPFMTLRAWPGYDLADGDDHQVVKHAFHGQVDVHDLRHVSLISGRKMRSTALPIQASSMGGLPTMVVA